MFDSFVSCFMNDVTFFQIEFYVPFFCPFIKFVKIPLEHSCVCHRLKAVILNKHQYKFNLLFSF